MKRTRFSFNGKDNKNHRVRANTNTHAHPRTQIRAHTDTHAHTQATQVSISSCTTTCTQSRQRHKHLSISPSLPTFYPSIPPSLLPTYPPIPPSHPNPFIPSIQLHLILSTSHFFNSFIQLHSHTTIFSPIPSIFQCSFPVLSFDSTPKSPSNHPSEHSTKAYINN